MLGWLITFAVLALAAAFFAFGLAVSAFAMMAKILFYLFLVAMAISAFLYFTRRRV